MARAEGVVIASEHFWAFARRDGTISEGTMPTPPAAVRRVPLLRGLVRLGLALAPLFRGTAVARPRERALLVVALLAPLSLVFLPHAASLPVGITTAVVLLAWLLRGRTLYLHGAEHRAIAAAEEGSLLATWSGAVRPTRFSPRCGTNFAALVLPVSVAADRFWPLSAAVYTPFAVTLLSLALTMELWQLVQASHYRAARAVHSLTHRGRERLRGPKPHDDNGHPLAPLDAWGHDQLWWLDRMVRTTQPLAERMTLVWHDWFATSRDGVDSARLMIRQNKLFRTHGLGSFGTLLTEVTKDPAMLIWLSGTDNTKDSPNENYGRELLELFTIGADRGGYTERDVREQARALTGWRNDWNDNVGPVNFRYDPRRHDDGVKTIFGKHGRFTWRDSARLCVQHRLHPSFFVTKLLSYFVPTAPSSAAKRELQHLYTHSGHSVRPVVEAILKHPALYEGPRMVKPPAVYVAGLLRALRRGIDTEDWTSLLSLAGQQLFYPPNVAGWDDTRWLATITFRSRWMI